jgi:putative ABC transport system substrate-binding protein
VTPDSFLDVHRTEVISLAAHFHLTAVYPFRQFSEAGGLLSYGNDQLDNFRRAAVYVDRILRGAKPMVINLKTAQTLGLDVPPTLLAHADEVIE